MKTKILLSIFIIATMQFILCNIKLSAREPEQKNKELKVCGYDDALEYQRKLDPGIDQRIKVFEETISNYLQKNPYPKTQGVVTIPVVFHIVWRVAAENLSDDCLKSQIDAMNRDFRKLNTDISIAPAQFQAVAADCEFNFCLATKDPQGNSTSGIVRKQTTVTQFTTDNKIKYNSSGGSTTWGNTSYLNIWVGNLNSGGYSYQPCLYPAEIDGVALHYQYTGQSSNCTTMPLRKKGRTAVHEIGHYLGLKHTFEGGCAGNTASTCATEGDKICDTPPSSSSASACTQKNTCTETPTNNIDMIWNYEDYTNDDCRVMFTAGQKAKMVASYNQCRTSLGNGAATKCSTVEINDISISDNISFYPNPSDGNIFMHVDLPNINSINVTIYNAIGEAILSKKIVVPVSKEIKLDMNNNPDGIYLIEVK
ncbi:MAG: M43 family zinc metalloprotease, partial [Bacteroidota bacterium]